MQARDPLQTHNAGCNSWPVSSFQPLPFQVSRYISSGRTAVQPHHRDTQGSHHRFHNKDFYRLHSSLQWDHSMTTNVTSTLDVSIFLLRPSLAVRACELKVRLHSTHLRSRGWLRWKMKVCTERPVVRMQSEANDTSAILVDCRRH